MELTEDLICRRAIQYDAALVHDAHLSACSLASLGNSLQCCVFLTRLDLHQNKLSSLAGVDAVGATLEFLNVAENVLVNIDALKVCANLRTLYVEGNLLSSEKELLPLRELSHLNTVVFQRRVVLEGEKDGLLLDNPFCHDTAVYKRVVESLLSHVRWVDGEMFRGNIQGGMPPKDSPTAADQKGSAEAAPTSSYEDVRALLNRPLPSSPLQDADVQACLYRLGEISADMAVSTMEEKKFQRACTHDLEVSTSSATVEK